MCQCSQNGTYINDVRTKLRRGERYELKSGDEIFLANPTKSENVDEIHFIFVNKRERDIMQRAVLSAHSSEGSEKSEETPRLSSPADSMLGKPDHFFLLSETGNHIVFYFCLRKI